MSYIDIAIIVLVALFALIGLWKGVFKSVVAFFGWFISMLIAVFLTKVVSYALLDVKAIGNFVCGSEGFSLYNWILSFLPEKGAESGILSTIVAPIYTKIAGYAGLGALGAEASRQAAALMLAYGLFSVIVCIGLFIAIRVIMMLLTMFVKSFAKDGKPSAISRLLGFVVGAARGLAYSALILMIMGYALAIPQLSGVGAQIDKSVMAKPIYTTVQNMTNKLFTGKDDETLNKLVAISGVDLDGEEEELPEDPSGGDEVGGGEEQLPPDQGGEELPDQGGEAGGKGGAEQQPPEEQGGGDDE